MCVNTFVPHCGYYVRNECVHFVTYLCYPGLGSASDWLKQNFLAVRLLNQKHYPDLVSATSHWGVGGGGNKFLRSFLRRHFDQTNLSAVM